MCIVVRCRIFCVPALFVNERRILCYDVVRCSTLGAMLLCFITLCDVFRRTFALRSEEHVVSTFGVGGLSLVEVGGCAVRTCARGW
jgi:hypothetical protein